MNPKYLRSLPPLFGRPVLAELAEAGRSPTFSRLVASAGLDLQATVGEIYLRIYSRLLREHRCEYVFKNQIARHLLLERHAWGEARLLTEFRIGPAKADVVILNGTSKVYEVKTGLDNLDRLPHQLAAYALAFDRIYVVCEAEQTERISDSLGDDRIGLITMQGDGSLQEVRTAGSNAASTHPETMLAALRKAEYLEIVTAEAGAVPDVPNGRLWTECVRLIRGMDPERVHSHMVRLLRARAVPGEARDAIAAAPALTHAILTLAAPFPRLVHLARVLDTPITAVC